MKRIFYLMLICSLTATAQKSQVYSISVTNNATAFPYGILKGYFTAPVHPGIELGWNQTLSKKKKHDWFRGVHVGYFYHRFVQHGIPLYVDYGYRYKAGKAFQASAALGAGYFHSIPAVEVLKNENGEYRNAKGIGRPQAMVAFTLGAGYTIPVKDQPLTLFINYQVRLQTPFVKSYVPVLPYNQVAVGASLPLKKTSKK